MVVRRCDAGVKSIRVLVTPGALMTGVELDLDADELHHLKVRRIAPDSAITAMDGAGTVAGCRLIDGSTTRPRLAVGHTTSVPRPAPTTLVVGAGDKERFASLAERCTELGVSRLVPLKTERSQAVDTRLRPESLARVRRRAREACKQSGNAWAALVDDETTIDALAAAARMTRWFLASPGGTRCGAVAQAESIGWLIGPEGGFTADEIARLTFALDAAPVCLAPSILRFDTAAIAAAVLTGDRRDTH